MFFVFQFRRGTTEQWAIKNPILGAGEPGIAVDSGQFKIGNGVLGWNDLPYYASNDHVSAAVQEAIDAQPPLNADDMNTITTQVVEQLDIPDLVLLWENAKA